MRDLVLHAGQVHRWARAHVADRLTEVVDPATVMGPAPDDATLVDWFRDGHESLVATLAEADPDLQCWSFLSAPSPLAFWARRQCHETGMHRVDAQSATATITPFPADVAADGIDELLRAFITRPGGRLQSDTPRTLLVCTTDTDESWRVRIADTIETELVAGDADCTVRGSASDLHLFLWNRLDADALDLAGDRTLLDLWRESVTIRWR
jgi:uncharacterized protein (TIGR03083 family)